MANEIVEAVAKRGNVVLLGRAGFSVLGSYADVLNVRIGAPFSDRVQRVMAHEGLTDLDAAMARVKEDDEVHRKYVQRFYNKQWDDPANFDLIIDTGSLSKDEAVQQIFEAARALEQKPLGPGATTAAMIEVDSVLADAVNKTIANPLPALRA